MKPRGIPKRPNFRPKINTGRKNPFTVNKQRHPDKGWYGENWDELSTYVKQRDNYTCQVQKIRPDIRCGVRLPPPFSKLLHAHHIIPLPKGANHPSNLITLCNECHGKVHGKYLGKISDKQRRAASKL